jgi:UDP-glucose 4-epimerase
MRPRRVLVTGVSRFLGGHLAAALAADPEIEAVIGVDTVEPRLDLGRTEVVRADIRSPSIARTIAHAEVDTVVHLSVVATPLSVGGRTAMKEINVIGTMQLLAACQKSPTVRKLVLKSTTAVYGSSPKDPALFTEDDEPRRLPRSGYAKDSVEVEGYVRGFGRRRPDVALTMLRFTNFVGPRIDTPLTRYFSLPVVPKVFGFDPRIQFLHEDDAVEVLRLATLEDKAGIYNVGGDGVLLLSQAIRRAGRVSFPILEPLVSVAGQGFRRAGLVDFTPEQLRFLEHGRVVDTARLHERFGYRPRYTSMQAFDDFVRARGLNRTLNPDVAVAVERAVLTRLTRRNESVHA